MSWFCNHKYKVVEIRKVNVTYCDSDAFKTEYIYISRCIKCGKIKKVVT